MKKKDARLGCFFAIMFIFNMAANFVHPVTPSIIVDLQLDDSMFGLALAAMMLCNFLFSPFWGKTAGFISSKKVMLLSGIGYGVGQIFFALANTEIQFLLARMFAGIFVGGCYVSFTTYTVNCSSDENRGKNLAINATAIAVSNSFGYFVGGMIGEVNVYYSVWLQVIVLVLTSVIMYFVLADDRAYIQMNPNERLTIRECNPFSAILQCRRFMTKLMLLLFLSYGLANLGYTAFEQCFNFYLRDQFQLSSGYNGVIKAALGVISLIANSTLCMWILKKKKVSGALAVVMGVCSIAMIGVILTGAMIPFIVVNIVFFAFYFVSTPLYQDLAAFLGKGEDSNLVMGSFNAVKSFGSIFGSALAGLIYAMHEKLPFAFGFVFFFAAAAMIVLFVMEEKNRKW